MKPARIMRNLLPLALAAVCVGCKAKADPKPLDEAGIGYSTIEALRALEVTDAEVTQVVKARRAGLRDASCLELVRLARSRGWPFHEGDAVAALTLVNFTEDEILELGRLNQLGLWVGEAQAMRFAAIEKGIVLSMARARAARRPVPSSAAMVKLKDAGFSDSEMLTIVERGTTDAEALSAAQGRQPRGTSKFRRLRR
jgi:hypothetical protein